MTTPPTLPGGAPSRSVLDALYRQALRSLAKTDFYAYQEYVFGYKTAPHIRAMVEFIEERVSRGENGVVLAPRGSTKTTSLTTGWLSFKIAQNQDIRVGLFSQKDEKAEAMSNAIRTTVSESEAFRDVFGDLRGESKWSDSEWLRKGSRWVTSKDRTMVTGGVNNSSAVSKRFDLIFCDDILDAENTYNIDRREKTEDWFWKTMKPSQAAEGVSIIVVGTRWTEGDLYERLVETNKWPSLIIPAITQDESGADVSYWPEVWPLSRLYAEREDVGWDNFACSYLNNVSGQREGTIFRKEWFDYFDELPAGGHYLYTMGVDLASSESERADFTARVVVAESEDHHFYVMSTSRMKQDSGHRKFIEDGAAAWPSISRIVIESNQHQSTLVQDILDQTKLPAVGKRTDTDKRVRARGVATRYESHRIHHHRSLKGGEYETELLNYPKTHDDFIDAAGLAMDITGTSGSIAAATGSPLRTTEPVEQAGSEVRFAGGPEIIPAYMAQMLAGIETERLTREEAIVAANRRTEAQYVNRALAGVLRGQR